MPISEQTHEEFEAYKAGTASPEVAARIGAKLKDPDSDLSRWFGERHEALKARKRRHHCRPPSPADAGEVVEAEQ